MSGPLSRRRQDRVVGRDRAPGVLSRRGAFSGLVGVALIGATASERAFADEIAELRERPVGSDRLWLKRPDGSELIDRFRHDGYDEKQILLLSWFMRDIHDRDEACGSSRASSISWPRCSPASRPSTGPRCRSR
jgi:hypothetical protein